MHTRWKSRAAELCGGFMVLVFGWLGTGCGTLGGVAPVPARFDEAKSVVLDHRPEVADMRMTPAAGVNQAVGAFDVGRFDTDELSVLQRSLDETFAAWNAVPGAPKLSVHAHVRLYALSFSNIELGNLIAVDWCAVQENRLLADERI
ncbi:hypothetical protein [Congregicoccus parvus]|uniref:hypothetical protein n=1 Tax=Congregicoccus parvus TaxID=3081749 RepID=UPI003FA5BABF